MSSTTPLPLRISTRVLSTSTMSELSPFCSTSCLRPRRRAAEILLVVEDAAALGVLAAEAAVELHPTDRRQVVAIVGEEQIVEQVLRRLLGRRLAGAHHAVDLHLRLQLVGGRIDPQGVGDVRAMIEIVGEQRAELLDALVDQQRFEQLLGDLVVGLGQQFAGLFVDQVVRQGLADQVITRHLQLADAGFSNSLDVARGDALARLRRSPLCRP